MKLGRRVRVGPRKRADAYAPLSYPQLIEYAWKLEYVNQWLSYENKVLFTLAKMIMNQETPDVDLATRVRAIFQKRTRYFVRKRSFTPEMRAAFTACIDAGLSANQAAERLGLGELCARKWKKRYLKGGLYKRDGLTKYEPTKTIVDLRDELMGKPPLEPEQLDPIAQLVTKRAGGQPRLYGVTRKWPERELLSSEPSERPKDPREEPLEIPGPKRDPWEIT